MAKFIQGQNGCSDSHDQRKPLSTPNKCKDRNMKKAKENYSGENKIWQTVTIKHTTECFRH